MNLIDDEALRKRLPSFEYSISAPIINPSPKVYFKQLDLVFKKDFFPDRDFVENSVAPAICGIAGLEHEGLTMWGDELNIKPPALLEKPGFLERLKNALNRPL